jgi:hypothetical protein
VKGCGIRKFEVKGCATGPIEFYTDKKVVIELWGDQHARKF